MIVFSKTQVALGSFHSSMLLYVDHHSLEMIKQVVSDHGLGGTTGGMGLGKIWNLMQVYTANAEPVNLPLNSQSDICLPQQEAR